MFPRQINLNVRGLSPSATVAINELSDELKKQGREIFKLGLGESPFPVPQTVAEALRANAHQKSYLPTKGLRELREAVAEHHKSELGLECTADDVMIGPGSKELMFLLQLVYYGDILIPTPAWVSYAPQARIIGRHVSWIRTDASDGWKLRPERLEALCETDPGKPRVLILNYPSNPTGATYTSEELGGLAEVAKRQQVILLSDEIYGRLHHEGRHVSIAPMFPEGTILSGGLSKWCGAGGWRLGLFIFPPSLRWLLDAMAVAASETFTSTSAPIQYAAIEAFRGGPEIDSYLDRSRRILKALGGWITDAFRKGGAEVVAPDGAFYLFPDLGVFASRLEARGIQTSRELCQALLRETGVAVLPGSDFGRPESELTIRLAYVDFDGSKALDAARSAATLDEAFLRAHCGRVLEGIDRLIDWVSG